jgi:hypothetical protein
MLSLEWSFPPHHSLYSASYYISCVFDFTAHWEEVGWFWHLYHQGIRPPHLFCLKKFLAKTIEELAEVWLICTCHVTVHMWPIRDLEPTVSLRVCLNQPILTTFLCSDPESTTGEGGRWLGSPSRTPPPRIRKFFFLCLLLLSCMTSGVFFRCKLSLLKQHSFLILTQPSWDGYWLL